jgi:DHA1 family bicyclomycin/chloramphenicol resistance-like MFS transporter
MTPARAPSQREFVVIVAMLFATIAFSIDAMLPALPEIAASLSPEAPNRAQLVVASFVLGMGAGTLVMGPLSDALGRKPVILGAAGLYLAGAVLAWRAETLDALLIGRAIQGVGAAGPRVVALAIVRDLHAGRTMARIMSLVMTVFILFPAVAPLIGAGIIALAGWRAIFAAFVLFSLVSVGWLLLRLPETLPPEARRPVRPALIAEAVSEMLGRRTVVVSIAAQTLAFAMLFAMISTVQPVFDRSFDRAATFPVWFAAIAAFAASGSLLNAAIVERVGMRRIATTVLGLQAAASLATAGLLWSGTLGPGAEFALYVGWTASVFLLVGLTIGNLNALAMEPLGHVAGLAASVVGAVATIGAILVAAPIGLAFDGTPRPVALGVGLCAAGAYGLLRLLRDPAPASA